jgi:hypothetical protein
MFELLWPLVLLSLPLPLLVRRLLPPAAEGNGAALRVPFFGELETLAGVGVARGSSRSAWAWLAWALLCLAAARPQWVGEAQSLPMSGRDLMLAVDVSGSMAAEDMEIGGRNVDRLTAVKVVLGDFLQRRIGDRVGLVLFGQFAYQMTPLTFDRNSVRYQLETSAIGLAGRETAIGDAIGLAVKRLRQRPSDQRVLILLTDGVNTAGQLPPLKAAEIAQPRRCGSTRWPSGVKAGRCGCSVCRSPHQGRRSTKPPWSRSRSSPEVSSSVPGIQRSLQASTPSWIDLNPRRPRARACGRVANCSLIPCSRHCCWRPCRSCGDFRARRVTSQPMLSESAHDAGPGRISFPAAVLVAGPARAAAAGVVVAAWARP